MRRQAKPVLARAVADNAATLGRATAGAAAAAGLVAGLGASAYANAPVDDTQRESTSVQMAQGEQAQYDGQQAEGAEGQSYETQGYETQSDETQGYEGQQAEQQDQGAADQGQQTAAQSPNIEPVSQTTASGGNQSVVSAAYSGIGSPYVWGGSTPGGWDCSGFVNWAYQQSGQSLPARTASGLWASGTTTSNPQPGDLVIEHGGSHVAIYIGNGQAIGAQNPSTGTVQYTLRPGNVNAYVTF